MWTWPKIDISLLVDNNLQLPIQIKGKLVSTIKTQRGYAENEVLEEIYEIEKVKNKLNNKKIIKIINVQDKIINIITN
jgi:leucyl-tRNA synthetase